MSLKLFTLCRPACPTVPLNPSSPSVCLVTSLTAFRTLHISTTPALPTFASSRRLPITSKMSFSNTETPAGKPADPYKATNKTEPDLKEKVEDLVNFISACKFGMMTTRIESSGLLTSRCMALAAKVGLPGSTGIGIQNHINKLTQHYGLAGWRC